MRGPEKKFWKFLQPKFKVLQDIEFERIENKVGCNTPDLNYSFFNGHGWIELKATDKFHGTFDIVKFPHFTEGQKNWLLRRGKMGGNCWLLVLVEEDIMLFNYQTAQRVGNISWSCMMSIADFRCKKKEFDASKLMEALT
jgi:hypothetical protein